MNGAFRLGIVSSAVASGARPAPPVPTSFGWGDRQGGATTLSNSDRTISAEASVSRVCVIGKNGHGTGKRYFEITQSGVLAASGELSRIGVAPATWDKANVVGNGPGEAAVSFHGFSYMSGAYTGKGSMGTPLPSTAGAVTRFAIDLDTGDVWVGVNASWKWSGNPAAGTNPSFSGLADVAYFPGLTVSQQVQAWSVTLSERAEDFSYAPPSGFLPWVV